MGDITVEEEAETRFIADSSKGAKTEATGKATFSCGTPAVSDGTATSFLTDETLVDAGGTTTLTAGTQVVADEKAWLFTGGRSLTVGLDRTTAHHLTHTSLLKMDSRAAILTVRGSLEVRCHWCNCYFWLFVPFLYMIVFS